MYKEWQVVLKCKIKIHYYASFLLKSGMTCGKSKTKRVKKIAMK